MTLRLERLSRLHRPLLDRFENDAPELVVYLRRWALVHEERDRLGRTWIALDGPMVAGFFTLAAASLARAPVGELARLPRFPIPAVLLARLAVDRRVQRQGLGTWLFDQALAKTLVLASDSPVAFRVLITDAKDERAASFYDARGMTRIGAGGWPRRMVLDLKRLLRAG